MTLPRARSKWRVCGASLLATSPSGLPRWFNVVAALLGLCLLAPFLALLWLLVRLDSEGPGMFHQPRVGRRGRLFTCHKLRTMESNAPEHETEIVAFSSYVFNPLSTVPDHRLTRLGRTLRRTSVDELPQLINVLRGEMALVGPRPELPAIVRQYPAAYHRRHVILPGMSGLAQVSGRSNLTLEQTVSFDLEYVARRSPWLDLTILWRTAETLVGGVGAR